METNKTEKFNESNLNKYLKLLGLDHLTSSNKKEGVKEKTIVENKKAEINNTQDSEKENKLNEQIESKNDSQKEPTNTTIEKSEEQEANISLDQDSTHTQISQDKLECPIEEISKFPPAIENELETETAESNEISENIANRPEVELSISESNESPSEINKEESFVEEDIIAEPTNSFTNSDSKEIELEKLQIAEKDLENENQTSENLELKSEESNVESIENVVSSLNEETEIINEESHQEYNFYDWLKAGKPSKTSKQELNKSEIIDKFIETNPKLKPIDKEDSKNIKPIESTSDFSNITSETLAELYVKQGKYKEAIEAYKTLNLKYPEKSGFFATQIQDLEEKLKEI